MLGEVVGSYRVVRKLGAGGMGEVWAAEHVLLGQTVAIKVLLPEVTKHEGIVKRFFDEARAATQIADPGIVGVHDFGWHARGAYIIMEYLPGESLRARLHGGQVPLAQALRIAQQIALTMSVAHGRGIIHRDLKPDNIFLVPDAAMPGGERVKILDFGIAKLIVEDGTASNTNTGVVMGTPLYMSPEQCRGSAGVDHRTDIYALGCILFELLCRRLPFVQPTTSDLIASHLRETPSAPSSIVPAIPPAVDVLVLRCLAKAPDDRFATMTDLARALADAAGAPLEIETVPPVRPSKRRPPPAAPTNSPTTLGHSAAESIIEPRRRSMTRPALVAAVTLAATAVTLIVATRNQATTASSSHPADSATERPAAPDAVAPAAVPADAAIADAILPVDAAVSGDAAVHKPGRVRRVPRGSAEIYDNR